VGTLGTVLSALPTSAHIYNVQFVDSAWPYLMDAHMLSKLPRRRITHAARRRTRVWRNRALASRRVEDRLTYPSSMLLLRAPARSSSYAD
jgi:hypothetical protein